MKEVDIENIKFGSVTQNFTIRNAIKSFPTSFPRFSEIAIDDV